MKRTNLVLDESLLQEAARVLGAKTYSAAVNLALEEIVNVRKIQNLQQFFGKDLWEGDLAEMREDAKPVVETGEGADSAAAAAAASGR
jgi:Arc/MetJ family transcription regulator